MNNFPFAWWDKTITIYNKLVDPTTQRVKWYRNTCENCFWKYVNETYVIGRGGISAAGVRLETKNVTCRIPKDERFVNKREWREMSDNERASYFTLGNGDIIILGEVFDVVDDYTEGLRATDLVAKYKELNGCLEIDTYVINTGTGVGMEHYRVVGK